MSVHSILLFLTHATDIAKVSDHRERLWYFAIEPRKVVLNIYLLVKGHNNNKIENIR